MTENIRSNEIGVGNTAQQFGIPNVNVDELPKGLPLISVQISTSLARRTTFPPSSCRRTRSSATISTPFRGTTVLKVGFGVIFRQTNACQSSFSRSQFVSTTIYTSNRR